MRTALYASVSSDRQEREQTIQSQLEAPTAGSSPGLSWRSSPRPMSQEWASRGKNANTPGGGPHESGTVLSGKYLRPA